MYFRYPSGVCPVLVYRSSVALDTIWCLGVPIGEQAGTFQMVSVPAEVFFVAPGTI